MHITVERSETTTGLLFKSKVYVVKFTVAFSEEEKAIIKERGLKNYTVFEYHEADKLWVVPLRGLVEKTHTARTFPTLIEAQSFEQELKTHILPALKDVIKHSGVATHKRDSYEL